MRYLSLIFLPLIGCSTAPMKASGSCAYKAGIANSYTSVYWKVDPSGACQFTLEAPIAKAKDAQEFADAFKTMFKVMPEADGVNPPKIEIKTEAK